MKKLFPLLLILPAICAGQSTLDELEHVENVQATRVAVTEAEPIIDGVAERVQIDCMNAFGMEAFCSCLRDQLPQLWNFSDYIAILTRTKAANGYKKLDGRTRKAYDAVPKVRDTCAAKLGK